MTAAVMCEVNALVSDLDPPLSSDLFYPHTAGRPLSIGAAAFQLKGLFRLSAGQSLVGTNAGFRTKTHNCQRDQPGRSRRRSRQGST